MCRIQSIKVTKPPFQVLNMLIHSLSEPQVVIRGTAFFSSFLVFSPHGENIYLVLKTETTATLTCSQQVHIFNTQPWFSTLHWGAADGFNTGKARVHLKPFSLSAPSSPSQRHTVFTWTNRICMVKHQVCGSRAWVYVQDYNNRLGEMLELKVTGCFTTQWFTVY